MIPARIAKRTFALLTACLRVHTVPQIALAAAEEAEEAQLAVGRAAAALDDSELLACIAADAAERDGAPPTRRMPLQALPASLLLRIHQLIKEPPASAAWDFELHLENMGQRLLACVAGGLLGMTPPVEDGVAGQRIDDWLNNGRRGQQQRRGGLAPNIHDARACAGAASAIR